MEQQIDIQLNDIKRKAMETCVKTTGHGEFERLETDTTPNKFQALG